MKKLPQEFTDRMKILLKDDYPLFEKEMNEAPQRAFRVNTDKISVEEFEKINIFGNEKIPYVKNGFYLNFDKVGNHPFHHAGMIYVQEPAAMAPAECLKINEDWMILDMCASPGGKSTQLKNKLSSKGVLVSNEIVMSRCKILTGNIERMGFKNTVTTCMDTFRLAKTFPETFDMIMVDAPCSGEGMFRKDDVAIEEWSEQNVRMCAERQADILENAVECLKKGGYIVYATCTFSVEENEMTVCNFLKKHPEFELVRVNEEVEKMTSPGICFDGCEEKNIHFTRRFYPHIARGEGQFMAVLHDTREKENFSKKAEIKPQKIDKLVADFLRDTLTDFDEKHVTIYNKTPVYFTPDFSIKDGTAFSCGVTIGEIAKNYIKPHHQFFMAMGNKFKRKIDLSYDSEEIKKYLHGEEFETNTENGWAVVTVCGCTLGGVKVNNRKAKNHYPKGLRSLN